jgi:hypothetical protein
MTAVRMDLNECRAVLRDYARAQMRKGELVKSELVRRVLDGEPLLRPTDTDGMRTNATRRLAGIFAWVLPQFTPLVLTELMRPSLMNVPASVGEEKVCAFLETLQAEYVKARKAFDREQERNRLSWARLADDLRKEQP